MKLTGNNKNSIIETGTECLVLGIAEDGPLGPSASMVDEASGGAVTAMLESGDISARPGKTTMLHRLPGVAAERVLAVGLGKTEKLTLPRYHRACLAAGRALRDHPLRNCHVCLHEVAVEGVDEATLLRQAALGVHRGNYLYTVTKQLRDDAPAPLERASFHVGPEPVGVGRVSAHGPGPPLAPGPGPARRPRLHQRGV